jgi:lipopolysaccharide biosynthesis regulator YciM
MCAEEEYKERLLGLVARMPDRKLSELVSVLEQAEDLSEEELEQRLADVFKSRGEEDL